jgi:spermidine/putrescine-binding protein
MMKPKVADKALAILIAFLLFGLSPVWGQSEDTKLLIEGAKKEGKLLWYTALNINDGDMLTKRFEQKYPFVKTETLRLGSANLLTKIQTEAKAGTFKADVIEIEGIMGHIFKKQGLLEKYVSPEAQAYPASFKDPDGFWTSFFINTHVLVYNTQLVKKEEVPRTFEELINPRWKGKIALRDDDFDTFGMMLKVMGKEERFKFHASAGCPGRGASQRGHLNHPSNCLGRDLHGHQSLRYASRRNEEERGSGGLGRPGIRHCLPRACVGRGASAAPKCRSPVYRFSPL